MGVSWDFACGGSLTAWQPLPPYISPHVRAGPLAAAGSLDKKAAKQYKARMLERLGAKADAAPRTKASIGKVR